MHGMKAVLVIFLIVISVFDCTITPNEVQNALTEGRQKYNELSLKVTQFGSCWKSSLLELHVGCRQLTDDVQSRLALSFANCFLENSGSSTCLCPHEKPVADCLTNVDDRIFSTYREFYTHTRNICYFLQHQIWQESTENTIQQLSSNSEKLNRQLEKSTKAQSIVLRMQHIALGKQQQLINNSEVGLHSLNTELEKSRNNAKAMLDEFKTSTDEQRMLIFAVFDHVKKLEALVIGEFTGMFTFVYYFLAIILCYILTSTQQTNGARIWLFLLFTLNFIFERFIIVYSMDEETLQPVLLYSDGPLYYRVWLCRKACCFLSFVVLAVISYHYQDYNVINNLLLQDIMKQNTEFQHFMKNMSNTSNMSSLLVDKSTEPGNTSTGNTELPMDSADSVSRDDTSSIPWFGYLLLWMKKMLGVMNSFYLKGDESDLTEASVSYAIPVKISPALRNRVRMPQTRPHFKFNNSLESATEVSGQSFNDLSITPSNGRYNLRNRSSISPVIYQPKVVLTRLSIPSRKATKTRVSIKKEC